MSDKLCAECGNKSTKKYCSKKCADDAWRKSERFLKNKCEICGNPCHNKFCSKDCSAKNQTTIHTTNCLTCGKEFTFHKMSDKLIGKVKYCSYTCSAKVYSIDENFFLGNTDIPTIYEMLGFLFSSAYIRNYGDYEICINSTKELIERFNSITKSDYPINPIMVKNNKRNIIYRTIFRSKIIMDYLCDIGFSYNIDKHTFPTILPEYKKYFIKGFISSPNCCVYYKKDHNLVIFLTKSYPIVREVSEITNNEIVCKNTDFCCAFKDYDKFY